LIKDHILVIGDTHLPFELPGYLEFCLSIQKRVKCGTVVHIGDLVDNHAISYHEHDANGKSPIDEMLEADKHLKD
jgi:predicted phosphodiesterase